MDSSVVVVVDLEIKGFHEFRDGFESGCITEVFFELAVEGFLKAVLPRRSLGAERGLNLVQFEKIKVGVGLILTALIGVEIGRCRMFAERIPQSTKNQLAVVPSGE